MGHGPFAAKTFEEVVPGHFFPRCRCPLGGRDLFWLEASAASRGTSRSSKQQRERRSQGQSDGPPDLRTTLAGKIFVH